jgi:hypothetical protein
MRDQTFLLLTLQLYIYRLLVKGMFHLLKQTPHTMQYCSLLRRKAHCLVLKSQNMLSRRLFSAVVRAPAPGGGAAVGALSEFHCNRSLFIFVSALGDALSSHVTNPSIGEVSLGASLSLGSACHLDERDAGSNCNGGGARSVASSSITHRGAANVAMSGSIGGVTGRECDRESASNTAIAGSVTSAPFANGSIVGGGGAAPRSSGNHSSRLEVGADVHNTRSKKFSLSSETVSLSVGDNASTKALAGSILAYRFGNDSLRGDSQSVSSYKTDILPPSGDEISLRSLPSGMQQQQLVQHQQYQQQRSVVVSACCRGSKISSAELSK